MQGKDFSRGWSAFCRFVLTRIMGWTIDTGPAPSDKAILLGVPHTSKLDIVVSYLYYTGMGRRAHVMVKKEHMVGIVGWLIRKIGGIPVDRSSNAAMVRSLITEMEKAETFHLAIAVEGTRAPVKHWKTGYHLISKATGAPVYLAYYDWGTKHIGMRKEPFALTDDARADTDRIQAEYEKMGLVGKHPEKYITH